LKKLKKEHNIKDMKKLYKSDFDQILTGVIGGVGEYFDVDPTVLRIGFVLLVVISGIFPGIIAYIIAYFLIPERPHAVSTIVTPPPMEKPETPLPAVTPETPTQPEQKPEPTPETKTEEPTSTI
jgi:phage shock protein C